MKYNILNQAIPQNSRRELNDKILYLIDNDLAESSGITKEDIYNAYTGDGGLHGLKYSDFDSYYEYSNAKKEIENGQFFTPPLLCKFIMDCLNPSGTDVVADLTCGMGGFFNFAPAESNVYGCELDIKAYKVAKYLYPKANITYEISEVILLALSLIMWLETLRSIFIGGWMRTRLFLSFTIAKRRQS